MFGLAAVQKKDESRELSLCRELRTLFPREVAAIPVEETPLMSEWGLKALQLHPEFLREKQPISRALGHALEKLLLYKSFTQS